MRWALSPLQPKSFWDFFPECRCQGALSMASMDKLCPALCFYPWDLFLPIHVPMESCILRTTAAGFVLIVLPLQQELDLPLCFTGGKVRNNPHWSGQNERWGSCLSPHSTAGLSTTYCTPMDQSEVGCVGLGAASVWDVAGECGCVVFPAIWNVNWFYFLFYLLSMELCCVPLVEIYTV